MIIGAKLFGQQTPPPQQPNNAMNILNMAVQGKIQQQSNSGWGQQGQQGQGLGQQQQPPQQGWSQQQPGQQGSGWGKLQPNQ